MNYGGVYHSSNEGVSWRLRNDSLKSSLAVRVLKVANGYLFAGLSGGSVWKRTVEDIISVKKISTEVPDKYTLGQNYPNPFNSMTKIQFQVPSSKFIKLVVFDLLGREVRTLVNEYKKAGTYEVRFESGDLPSGIYFYRMETNGFTDVKRMILLK